MAQIEVSGNKSKGYSAKKMVRVDLTPMVDLGFLLITFFILTTALSEPTVAHLIMPKDSIVETPVKENAVLTLSLTRNDSVNYYEGIVPKMGPGKRCSVSAIRSVIQQKQLKVAATLGNRKETVIIIHPGRESTYKNFVDVLDEIQINDVRHYFVVDDK